MFLELEKALKPGTAVCCQAGAISECSHLKANRLRRNLPRRYLHPAEIFRHMIYLMLTNFHSIETNAVWWLFIIAISPYPRRRRFADAPS
jgi:hypothetical protein